MYKGLSATNPKPTKHHSTNLSTYIYSLKLNYLGKKKKKKKEEEEEEEKKKKEKTQVINSMIYNVTAFFYLHFDT